MDNTEYKFKAIENYVKSAKHLTTISTGTIIAVGIITKDIMPDKITLNFTVLTIGLILLVISLFFSLFTIWIGPILLNDISENKYTIHAKENTVYLNIIFTIGLMSLFFGIVFLAMAFFTSPYY